MLDTSRVSTFCIAILLIVYGSFRSLNMEQEARLKEKDKPAESVGVGVQTMDGTQAVFLPIGASVSLLVMFFFFDSLQTVFALCSAVIGTVAFAFLLLPMSQYLLRPCTPDPRAKLSLGPLGRFTSAELLSFTAAFGLVCLWILTGHWLLMDALGMGLCVAFIALVRLPSLKVSTLLLSGLLVYDVFWVFFSSYIFNANVMVRVATRPVENPMGAVARKLRLVGVIRDAPRLSLPGKLVFPSIAHNGHFSMLGLGDIVMPGLLLCFVLRYDAHRKDLADEADAPPLPSPALSRVTYFHCSLIGYFLGLLTATLSSEFFAAAQPALLYLVPFTLLPLLLMAYLKGDLRRMWHDPFLPPEKPPKSQVV